MENLRIHFGSIRHLFRANKFGVHSDGLSGGVSLWDEGKRVLTSWPIEKFGEISANDMRKSFIEASKSILVDVADPHPIEILSETHDLVSRVADGALLSRSLTITQRYNEAHVQDSTRIRIIAQVPGGRKIWQAVTLPQEATRETMVNLVIENAERLEAIVRLEAEGLGQNYRSETLLDLHSIPILFRGQAACLLAHEMLGHLFEWSSDNAKRLERLGSLSSLITLAENPVNSSYTYYRRDSEGTLATFPTRLIDSGQIVGAIHSRSSARSAGSTSTGHGRRQDYCFPPMTRMAALCLEPGKSTKQELLEASNEMIIIKELKEGRMYGGTGLVEVYASSAEWRRANGVVKHVGPCRIQVGIDHGVQKGMLLIGERPETSIHSCLRGDQQINVSITSPDLLVLCESIVSI